MTLSHILPYVVTASDPGVEQNNSAVITNTDKIQKNGYWCRHGLTCGSRINGYRTQHIEIHYHFDVAVTTAAADSMKCDNKRKVA